MAEQCKGLTKSGSQCKNKNGLVNGYCNVHSDQAPEKKADSFDEKPEPMFENSNPAYDDFEGINNGSKTMYVVAAIIVLLVLVKLMRRNGK